MTESHDENKCIINIRLMKMIKIYEVFDPKFIELYGRNVYRTVNYVFILINIAMAFTCGWSVYCCMDDYYSAILYVMMLIVLINNSFKSYYVIRNAEAIWDCIDFTSVDFLSYGYYRKDILRAGRNRCIQFTNFFSLLWGMTCLFWMVSPLLINDLNRHVQNAAVTAEYHLNVFNFLFPRVSAEFYNEHFLLFYAIECALMVYNLYALIMPDIIIVSFCMTVSVQLKTVSCAFESLAHDGSQSFYTDPKDHRERITEHESKTLKSFKMIIRDHQKVIEKTRDVYRIFGPIILLMIAVESNILVFQSFTLITSIMDGHSLTSPVILKLLSSIFVYVFHLFAVCFLFSDINKQKSDVNFSLYSCDWTKMGLAFKKILLNAMLVNDAEKSTLKITTKKIVNLEMFASVMHMCYSIISVMVKNKQTFADQ